MNIERLKLVQELVRLTAEVKGAPKLERIKKTGRIIAILKMLGAAVAESPERLVINSDRELVKAWDEDNDEYDRQTLVAACNEYLSKAHPTFLLVTRKSLPREIYQWEGGQKWKHWGQLLDFGCPLEEEVCEPNAAIGAYVYATRDGERLGERVEEIPHIDGRPSFSDFEAKPPVINSREGLVEAREVSVEEWKDWPKDRETLQSIIDGKHEDMRLPALYDAIVSIDARQKDNPEYPELLEKALDAWQKVIFDMTAKITG